jgi:hypothetical protein
VVISGKCPKQTLSGTSKTSKQSMPVLRSIRRLHLSSEGKAQLSELSLRTITSAKYRSTEHVHIRRCAAKMQSRP